MCQRSQAEKHLLILLKFRAVGHGVGELRKRPL